MAFHPLERLVNLHDGYRREFRVDGISLLLIQQEGRCYLLRNMCPHKGFPLHTGTVSGTRIRCAYHAMEFDLATGRCVQHPLQPGVKTYVPVYDGAVLGVDL